MPNELAVLDYSADWALQERNVEPRDSPGYLSLEDVVELYGSLGVAALEYYDSYWYDYSVDQLSKLAADAGLAVSAYVFDARLNQPEEPRRAEVERVNGLLDRGAQLGAPLCMVHPAFYDEEQPFDAQLDWLIDGLRSCAAHAESLGTVLVAENIDYPPVARFMGTSTECAAIAAAVDSPGFGLVYDCGATVTMAEDALEALERMAPYVAYVHLKNHALLADGEQAARVYPNLDGSRRCRGTDLADGEVDVPAVIAQLARIGYGGYVVVEYQGEEDPRVALPRNVEYVRSLLAEAA